MRRRSVLFMTVAGLAAIGAAMSPWTLADDLAVREIARSLGALAGMNLTVAGPVTLALLPAPRIKLDSISLSANDGTLALSAQQLRGQLQLWPLLSGRLVLADVTLIQPAISAPAGTGDASDLWRGALRLLSQTYERTRGGAAPVSRLTLVDGALAGGPANDYPLQAINATLSWPAPEATVALKGSAVLAGQPLEFGLSGLAPRSIAAGGDTDLVANLSSALARISLRGALTDGGRRFDGKLRASSPSLAQLDGWLKLNLPMAGADVALNIDGACSIAARGMAITSANVDVNNNTLEGALTVRPGGAGGWALGGTLAAGRVDITTPEAVVNELRQVVQDTSRWRAWDVDLRMSAGSVSFPGSRRARDVAASLLLRHDRLEFVLGGAEALGGAVKGRLTATPSPAAGVDIRLQASVDQVDATRLAQLLDSTPRIKGAASGSVTMEIRDGTNLAAWRQHAEGRGHLQVADGELTGLRLAGLRQRAREPGVAPAGSLRGNTAFTMLRTSWSHAGGQLTLESGVVQEASMDTHFRGSISLPDGATALSGSIAPQQQQDQTVDVQENWPHFRVTGTWAAPVFEILPPQGRATPAGSSPEP